MHEHAMDSRFVAGTRHGVILLLASVMPVMAIISLVPVLPLLLTEFSGVAGNAFLVPVAMTVPALCVALFSPLAGWLADRTGRKKLLIAALVLYAAFGIMPWFLEDLYQIIAARVLLGIAEAAIMTVAITLIGDYFEGERREQWIAMQVATTSIAAIVLIAVGGLLGEVLGSRGPFLLYLFGLPIALAAAKILFEPPITKGDGANTHVAFPYSKVLPLVATTLGVGIVFYVVIVQLGPILQLSGEVSPATIGIIGAAANVSVGIGSFVFNRIKNRAGAFPLCLGLGLAATGYAGAGLSNTILPIAAFASIACIGSGIMMPNMLTWTMRRLPPAMRGRGTGMWTGAFFLGQFVAPLLAAALVAATGGLDGALLAIALLVAIGAFAAFLARRRERAAG